MEIASFELSFSYAQLAVFNPKLTNPFNSWQPHHFAQGFSWRPESVSFRLLDEFGLAQIKVLLSSQIEIDPEAIRAILVPFSVDLSNVVEIASVDHDSKEVHVSKGEYALVFETGYNANGKIWCHFTFTPSKTQVPPKIIRADSGLSSINTLIMESHPA